MLPTKCISPAPQALFCPLCQNLFDDPVISTRCGHTFCRMCITEKTSSRGNVSNSVCPVDNIPFHRSDLVSNIALKGTDRRLRNSLPTWVDKSWLWWWVSFGWRGVLPGHQAGETQPARRYVSVCTGPLSKQCELLWKVSTPRSWWPLGNLSTISVQVSEWR